MSRVPVKAAIAVPLDICNAIEYDGRNDERQEVSGMWQAVSVAEKALREESVGQ